MTGTKLQIGYLMYATPGSAVLNLPVYKQTFNIIHTSSLLQNSHWNVQSSSDSDSCNS